MWSPLSLLSLELLSKPRVSCKACSWICVRLSTASQISSISFMQVSTCEAQALIFSNSKSRRASVEQRWWEREKEALWMSFKCQCRSENNATNCRGLCICGQLITVLCLAILLMSTILSCSRSCDPVWPSHIHSDRGGLYNAEDCETWKCNYSCFRKHLNCDGNCRW